MWNNGNIWVRPGLPTRETTLQHSATFGMTPGWPVGGTRQASNGGNCSNCGGAGRIIYTDPNDGQMKDIPCGSCSGSGQSSL